MSEAYTRSLKQHGLEDLQPRYRQLLLRLKSQHPATYDEAVARYHEEVEGAGDTGGDPVAAWLAYGCWLAAKLEPGSLVSIAESGRAEPASGGALPGPMLIHLPEAANRRGFVVAMPANATEAQRETAALLCE